MDALAQQIVIHLFSIRGLTADPLKKRRVCISTDIDGMRRFTEHFVLKPSEVIASLRFLTLLMPMLMLFLPVFVFFWLYWSV